MKAILKSYKMIGPLAMILLGGIYLLFRNNEHTIPSILSNTKSNEIEEFDRAESFYLKRLQVSPHGGLNQAALASIYVSKSKLTGNLQYMDKAEVLARKSLENLPYYNYEAQLVMAKVSETRHFFPEAIMRAKAVLNQKPIHQGALLTLVSSLLGYGKLNEAERYSSQLIELSPTIEPYAMRALVYLAQGKEQNALRDFQSALNSETVEDVRQSAWVRSLIGRYYLEKGFLSTSYKYLVSSLALVDDFHMALALMAELDEKKGNYKRADDNYSRAFKSKGEPAYLIKQARLREKTGDAQRSLMLRLEAERLIRDEMAAGPYGHHNELAEILLEKNDRRELNEAVVEAKKNSQQRQNSGSYFLLSEALYRTHNYPLAKVAIQKALSFGVRSCEYRLQAGKIEYALGSLSVKNYLSSDCLIKTANSLISMVGLI